MGNEHRYPLIPGGGGGGRMLAYVLKCLYDYTCIHVQIYMYIISDLHTCTFYA